MTKSFEEFQNSLTEEYKTQLSLQVADKLKDTSIKETGDWIFNISYEVSLLLLKDYHKFLDKHSQ